MGHMAGGHLEGMTRQGINPNRASGTLPSKGVSLN